MKSIFGVCLVALAVASFAACEDDGPPGRVGSNSDDENNDAE